MVLPEWLDLEILPTNHLCHAVPAASFKEFLAARYLARWSSGFRAAANSFNMRCHQRKGGQIRVRHVRVHHTFSSSLESFASFFSSSKSAWRRSRTRNAGGLLWRWLSHLWIAGCLLHANSAARADLVFMQKLHLGFRSKALRHLLGDFTFSESFHGNLTVCKTCALPWTQRFTRQRTAQCQIESAKFRSSLQELDSS